MSEQTNIALRKTTSAMRASGEQIGRASGFAGRKLSERPLVLGGALAAVLVAVGMIWLDYPLAGVMAGLQDTWVRPVFRAITEVGVGATYFIIFASILFLASFAKLLDISDEAKARADHIITICLFVLASMIIAGILLHVFKIVFGRWRPDFMFETGVGGFGWFELDSDAKSFPSGHSQLIWTVAVSLMFVYPRLVLLYVATAILIAVSRVMLNVHFFSDIVAGSYLGAAIPILLKRHFFDAKGLNVRLRWNGPFENDRSGPND